MCRFSWYDHCAFERTVPTKSRWILLFVMLLLPRPAQSQSAVAPLSPDERFQLCNNYSSVPVIFVGRAGAPVTIHISGEAEIEKARQNLEQVIAELKELQTSQDPATRMEREMELALREGRARQEVSKLRAMYLPLRDLTLIPMTVERPFRGVTESALMMWVREPAKIVPDNLYLVTGARSHNMIPPFPEIWPRPDITEYVEGPDPKPTLSALKELEFLTTEAHGSLFGALNMRSGGEIRGAPLTNIHIVVTTATGSQSVVTDDRGEFSISGIAAGRVEIKPLLPENLGIVNRSELSFEMKESGCDAVHLLAALDGRVRGRIVSSTGSSLERVQMTLSRFTDPSESAPIVLHESPTTVRPNRDGTYEFWAQAPGKYLLSASVERSDPNGRVRQVVTFYPGTDDRNAAVPITIGTATLQDGVDFVVVSE